MHSDWWDAMFWLKYAAVYIYYIVLCQSSSCFVGCKAELKATSWSETTLWRLFQYWLSVMWRLIMRDVNFNFSCFIHKYEFLFSACQASYCSCISEDTMSYQDLVFRTLCPILCSWNVQYCCSFDHFLFSVHHKWEIHIVKFMTCLKFVSEWF